MDATFKNSEPGAVQSFSERLRHSKALIPTLAVLAVTTLALAATVVGQRSAARHDAREVPPAVASPQALAQAPGTRLSFIAFPGTAFSSPHHNTFFLRGDAPLTSRLLEPVLVDAGTYLYHAGGSRRDELRGTPAHNTLSISGAISPAALIVATRWNDGAPANAASSRREIAPRSSL